MSQKTYFLKSQASPSLSCDLEGESVNLLSLDLVGQVGLMKLLIKHCVGAWQVQAAQWEDRAMLGKERAARMCIAVLGLILKSVAVIPEKGGQELDMIDSLASKW